MTGSLESSCKWRGPQGQGTPTVVTEGIPLLFLVCPCNRGTDSAPFTNYLPREDAVHLSFGSLGVNLTSGPFRTPESPFDSSPGPWPDVRSTRPVPLGPRIWTPVCRPGVRRKNLGELPTPLTQVSPVHRTVPVRRLCVVYLKFGWTGVKVRNKRTQFGTLEFPTRTGHYRGKIRLIKQNKKLNGQMRLQGSAKGGSLGVSVHLRLPEPPSLKC